MNQPPTFTREFDSAPGHRSKSLTGETFQICSPSTANLRVSSAIRRVEAKFAEKCVIGTGPMTMPITLSGRRFVSPPQLTLACNYRGGNGPAGFGWSLLLSPLTRKTQERLSKTADVSMPFYRVNLIRARKLGGRRETAIFASMSRRIL